MTDLTRYSVFTQNGCSVAGSAPLTADTWPLQHDRHRRPLHQSWPSFQNARHEPISKWLSPQVGQTSVFYLSQSAKGFLQRAGSRSKICFEPITIWRILQVGQTISLSQSASGCFKRFVGVTSTLIQSHKWLPPQVDPLEPLHHVFCADLLRVCVLLQRSSSITESSTERVSFPQLPQPPTLPVHELLPPQQSLPFSPDDKHEASIVLYSLLRVFE